MAEKILNTRIQLKYDTYENWRDNNPLLKKGEVAIATLEVAKEGVSQTFPTVLIKVGNGLTSEKGRYNSLPFASANAADVYAWAKLKDPKIDQLPDTLKKTIKSLQTAIGDGGSVSQQITSALQECILTQVKPLDGAKVFSKITQTNGKVEVDTRMLTKADLGLGNVEDKSVATIKDELTGTIASEDGKFVTGGAVYTALADKEAAGEAAKVDQKLTEEIKRAKKAEEGIATNTTAIETEKTRATEVESTHASQIAALEEKVKNVVTPVNFIGVTTTKIVDESTTTTVTIDGKSHTAVKGDIVIYKSAEFVFDGSKWVELGDTTADRKDINQNKADIAAEAERAKNAEASLETKIGNAKNYTDQEIEKIHKFTNQDVLDGISAEDVKDWNTEKGAKAEIKTLQEGAVAANTAAIAAINNIDTGILANANEYADGLNTALSNTVSTVKATADSAIQTVTGSEGLSADKVGTTVTIGFDDTYTFVFDCGNAADEPLNPKTV